MTESHACHTCKYVFTTELRLKEHVCNCSCENCGNEFNTWIELEEHKCPETYITRTLEKDPINPAHYKGSPARCKCGQSIECIQVSRWFNFNIGNVIKYLWRCDYKGDRQEQLLKAHWYLRDEIRKKDPDFDANL